MENPNYYSVIPAKVRYDDMNMKQVLEGVDGIICIGKFEKK